MAPLWLAAVVVFARRQTSTASSDDVDNEKALGDQNAHRSGHMFGRYDTDVDGEVIMPRSWVSSVWAFIRQSDGGSDDFNPQYRKLPIISGLLVPFSILMEIPGLTEHWYVRTDPTTGKPTQYQANSALLETGLAISMASAILANLALLTRYFEKSVKTSTMMAMFFLTLHDIINVITVSVFGHHGSKDDGFTFAQAYWFTVASTIISTITNVTLLIDFVRTKDFATSGSGLSHRQRSLVIIIIILFSWVAIGAGCFAALLDISFEDSLYFTIVSIETIGYGDIAPGKDAGSRIFSIIYIATAIFNLALAVSTISDVVSEAIHQAARSRRRIAARRRLKRQRDQAAALEHPTFIYYGGGRRFVDQTGDELHVEAPSASVAGVVIDAARAWISAPFGLSDLRGDDDDSDEEDELDAEINNRWYGDDNVHPDDRHLLMPRPADPAVEEEYKREIEQHLAHDRFVQMSAAFAIFILFWMLGGVIFMSTEGWSFGSALYFCFITYTTVGYGDLYPKSQAGRAIFVFWAILGVGGLTVFISVIGEVYAGAFSNAVSTGTYDTQVSARLHAQRQRQRQLELEARNADLLAKNCSLEQLAQDVIIHARKYHPHMRQVYDISGLRQRGNLNEEASRGLRELLAEELRDEDARSRRAVMRHPKMMKTCFTVSYDRSFDNIMQQALSIAPVSFLAASQSEQDAREGRGPRTRTHRTLTSNSDVQRQQQQHREGRQSMQQQTDWSAGDDTTGPPPTSDILQPAVVFDTIDVEQDLSATDNYVDNHV